jgi:octaprenyl-diphosphate synthase
MQDSTLPQTSVQLLQEAAKHALPRTDVRLAEAHALFAAELRGLERELSRVVRDGVAPATQAAAHLLGGGGKRIRPLTVLLSAACFGELNDTARDLALIAELVHLATLLHDDVLDDCQIRRGRQAARCLWGNGVSVLAGDLLLTHALERAAALQPATLLVRLLTTLRRLVDGEILQLRGRAALDLTQETYFRVVHGKTAALFEWAAQAGASVSDARPEHIEALGAYGRHLGVAFQLMDDALDYTGDVHHTGKAIFADLEEGKATLPLLLAVERQPSLADQLEALRAGDRAAAVDVATAVLRLDTCRVVRNLAREETDRALNALAALPTSRACDLLRAVAGELTARTG